MAMSSSTVTELDLTTPMSENDSANKTPRCTRPSDQSGRAYVARSKNTRRNATPGTAKSWVTYNSPLWRKDRVKTEPELSASMPTTPRIKSRMEVGFVNDAISTHIFSNRRKPIIPPYDAVSDRYAQAYFKSPFVQGIMERNKTLVNLKDAKRTVNKLSVRKRCKATPDVNAIRQRETGFVNDAIVTEKKRNKYKDIIPPYDAASDQLCNAYFQRAEIKRLVDQTCAPRASLKVQQKTVVT